MFTDEKNKQNTPRSLEAVGLKIVARNDTKYINHTL
jgi:hypothetical protein